jgi:hypothetical protein
MIKDNNSLISSLDQWVEYMQPSNKDIAGNWKVFKALLLQKPANRAQIQRYLDELHARLALERKEKEVLSYGKDEGREKFELGAKITSI